MSSGAGRGLNKKVVFGAVAGAILLLIGLIRIVTSSGAHEPDRTSASAAPSAMPSPPVAETSAPIAPEPQPPATAVAEEPASPEPEAPAAPAAVPTSSPLPPAGGVAPALPLKRQQQPPPPKKKPFRPSGI